MKCATYTTDSYGRAGACVLRTSVMKVLAVMLVLHGATAQAPTLSPTSSFWVDSNSSYESCGTLGSCGSGTKRVVANGCSMWTGAQTCTTDTSAGGGGECMSGCETTCSCATKSSGKAGFAYRTCDSVCNYAACPDAAGGVPKASSDKSASTTESQCALSCNSNTGAGELYSGSCVYYGSITEDENYRTKNVEANGTAACEDLCDTPNLGPMSDFVNYAPNYCCACGGNLCYDYRSAAYGSTAYMVWESSEESAAAAQAAPFLVSVLCALGVVALLRFDS